MTIDTNISATPYFDDFDETDNYYQILYRPSVAVQTRELNSMQSMVQDQINKFGRHIFKEGSVVEGCAFTFDNNYNYVKINDNYANNSVIPNIADIQGAYVTNSRGLQAVVVNTFAGFQAQAPDFNTLFVKYLNSSTYANGVVQRAFANNENLIVSSSDGAVLSSNVVVATTANSTGLGYAFTTTEGVIFKKGFFLRVPSQTLVVSRYNNRPDDISVGFEATETIITPEMNTELVDNAAGAPNYEAPGAHRLQIVPSLITRTTSEIANTSSFFSVCDFKNGLPVSIKSDPQYSLLGADMARRTYETNGDYVVTPFVLSTQTKTDVSGNANTNYHSLVSSPGLAYVKGHRVEFINNNTVPLRKGIDTQTTAGQVVSSNYGYYFKVDEYCGDFNNNKIVQLEIHSVAKNAISGRTFLSTGYSSTTKIGTAYCRGVAYESGIPGVDAVYRLYVFNLNMLPGYSPAQAKSIIYYNAGVSAVADIVLTYSASLSADIAVIYDTSNEIMVHSFGQKALKNDGFASEQYVYRNRETANFLTTGVATLTLAAADGSGTESFYTQGSFSTTAENSFLVIPTATGYSAAKTGTISSSGVAVTGVDTAFLTEYSVGDYIYADAETRRIVSITTNTAMTVDAAWSSPLSGDNHQKTFPAGVPINFQSSTRTISATTGTATFTLGETANAAFGAAFYVDVLRAATTSIKKTINRSSLVQIDIASHSAGASGPWCLGIPDAFRLNNVWVGSGTYANTNADRTNQFYIDNGQRDAFYNLSYLYSTTPLQANATLLVSIDHFTKNESQGHGYFNANSYPIDDANTSNTAAIQTHQIPVYTSRSSGSISDLRDCIDFRPYANNTANVVTSTTNITTNPSTTVVMAVDASLGAYLPTPDTSYTGTISYYLPRTDRIALTTSGEILINEGVSAIKSAPPLELPGTMTIGFASIPPYPSLIPSVAAQYSRYDYAVQMTMQQTKRFTMADIGKMSNRIDRLEYYTSLSLLEQSVQSLQIRSSTTGQNRFKNGIMVEPFKDFTISNTNDPQYRIAIDAKRNEARPFFTLQKAAMYFDEAASSNVVKTGEMVTLDYTEAAYQTQPYASRYHNCIEGNIYNFRGSLSLSPPGDVDHDITVGPDIISNVDLAANWANLQKFIPTAFGTAWGEWSTVGSSTSTQTGSSVLTGETRNADGSISQSYQTQVTSTTTSQLQQVGQQLAIQPTQTQINVGNYITNISVLPYVKPRIIRFTAYGMKPSAKLYAYFDSVPVSVLCCPIEVYTGVITVTGGIPYADDGDRIYYDEFGTIYKYTFGGWAADLQADASGTVHGFFAIPGGMFKAGQLEFKLTDISDLSQGEAAVTTQATTFYHASPISIQKSNAFLQVRDSALVVQEVIQQKTSQQSSVSYTSSVETLPATNLSPTTPVNPGGFEGNPYYGADGNPEFGGGHG